MKFMNSKGVTLTELMVSIAIIGVIMAPLSLVFYTGYNNYFIENDTMNTQQNARDAMDGIINDFRKFENFNKKYSASNELIKLVTVANQLDIKCGTQDTQIITYYFLNSRIMKRMPDGSEFVFCNDVVSFTAEEINTSQHDSNIINIAIQVKTGHGETTTVQNSYRRKVPKTNLQD